MFVWFRTFVRGHPRAILTATGRRVAKLAPVRLERLFVGFRTTVRVGYEIRANEVRHIESGFLRQSLKQILKTGLKRVWAEPSGFGQSPIWCAETSTKATLG